MLLRCEVCYKYFKSSSTLWYHRQTIHAAPAFCGLCRQWYSSDLSLKSHQRLKHSGRVSSFTCTFRGCNKSFRSRSYRNTHSKSHGQPAKSKERSENQRAYQNRGGAHSFVKSWEVPNWVAEIQRNPKKYSLTEAYELLKVEMSRLGHPFSNQVTKGSTRRLVSLNPVLKLKNLRRIRLPVRKLRENEISGSAMELPLQSDLEVEEILSLKGTTRSEERELRSKCVRCPFTFALSLRGR